MEGNTTEQDDLLATINGLTSGMDISTSMPQQAPAPQAPEMPSAPVMPDVAPMPSFSASPEVPPMSQPEPVNNMNIQMPQYQQMPQAPQMAPEMPSAPVMPDIPQEPQAPAMQQAMAADPFAASLGATPYDASQMPQSDPFGNPPQPEQSQIPTMTSRIPTPDNKIPTFDKPIKKKSNGSFGFIVALLIIAIIGAGVYACYTNGIFDKLLKKTSFPPVTDTTDTTDLDSFVNVPDDSTLVDTNVTPSVDAEFVDNTVTAGVNEKVIKANYKVNGLTYDDSYISLPYLNINSEDAKAINNELQEQYKNYANISADFRTENELQLNTDEANFKQRYLIVYYQSIIQGDVISLLINELKYDGTDAIWNHYTYCISGSTGKKLTLTDLETILNVNDQVMNTAYEAYITQLISSLTASEAKKTFEHKINAFKTLQDYYTNITKGEGIYYYVDGSGRINIITKVYIGDKNIYKVVAYSQAGCQVKEFKINDAKQAAGFKQMTKEDVNNGEATNTVASSLKVSANSLSSINDGDMIYGEDVIKLYRAYEYLLGSKGESVTFQLTDKNGTRSYSKGEVSSLENDITENAIYKVNVVKYASGSYRILKFIKADF